MSPSRRRAPGLAMLLTTSLQACEPNAQSALHPAGTGAKAIADLWWLMLIAAGAVFVLVLATLGWALFHRRAMPEEPHAREDRGPFKWIVAGGIGLPVVVLVPLLVVSLHSLAALKPPDGGGLEIEVTGWQWWWDVQYSGNDPQQRIRTANEIHIPIGRPIRVRLRSQDVIHSFWVPALQGKMDLVPGRVNTTWIQADTAGVYRGECAEYCGLQHTRMQLRVVAHGADRFAAWVNEQQRPAVTPPDSLGQAGLSVFLGSGCALCHTVRGTSARGVVGPDLTHLASRRTLAAGTLPNTKGHLAGWIANPQGIKPGNLMPRTPLRPEELEALLLYLQSLR